MKSQASALSRYVIFLLLGPAANLLWVFWVLPQINERGTWQETVQWIGIQSLFPLLFGILLAVKKKYVFWMLLVYSGFMILFMIGMIGWALMGPATPIAVYAVCALLMVMAFGLLINSLRDLKVGQGVKRYETED